VEGKHELFGFLTTDANAIVAPIHPKAMPVILTTPEEVDLWLEVGTRALIDGTIIRVHQHAWKRPRSSGRRKSW
jgi:putative SOS response-associated peptidase YedK